MTEALYEMRLVSWRARRDCEGPTLDEGVSGGAADELYESHARALEAPGSLRRSGRAELPTLALRCESTR